MKFVSTWSPEALARSSFDYFIGGLKSYLLFSLLNVATVHSALAAVPLLPDLVPITSIANNYMYGGEFDTASEPGRVLYRFDTVIANLGDGPFQISETTNLSEQTQDIFQHIFDTEGVFTQHLMTTFDYEQPPFGHLVFKALGRYSLREVTEENNVGAVIAFHDKTSHAVVDSIVIDDSLPESPAQRVYSSALANLLGISVGYGDLYGRDIPKQRIDVTGVPSGQYWLEVIVDPNSIVQEIDTANNTARILVDLIVPHPETVDGDYNVDGVVSAVDYTVWLDNLGAADGTLPNDADGGAIDAAQYATWKTNFGTSSGSGFVQTTIIPEPATWLTLLVGFVTLLIFGWPIHLQCTRPFF